MNQQSQYEQEREQRDQSTSWIEDHPDFIHVKSPKVFGTGKCRFHQAALGNRRLVDLQPGTPCPSKDMSNQGN